MEEINKYNYEDTLIVLGIDEAGRGPLLGRVYTSCVVLPNNEREFDFSLIKDSKKFSSKKKLHEVAEYIKEKSLYYSIDYVDESKIDKINILQATLKSMKNSIYNVLNKLLENVKESDINSILNNVICKIDGNYFKPIQFIYNDNVYNINYETIVKGDDKCKSISAASVLAKDSRDNYIKELCVKHPHLDEYYGLSTNMGYGTKKHMDGINNYGICEYHRKSFIHKKLK